MKAQRARKCLPEPVFADEIRERFRAQLSTIRTGEDALSYFVDMCTAWIEGVLTALYLATRLGPTKTPIAIDELLLDVEQSLGRRLKQARSDLLVKARDADCHAEVKPLVKSVIRGQRDLREAAAAPGVVLGSPSKRPPSLLAVRRRLLSDLDELTAMRGLLRCESGDCPPLSEQQKKIWELLDGQALIAREIAKRPGCGASEDSVRRQIKKMRRKGYDIQNDRSRGYYRKDAPPPDSP